MQRENDSGPYDPMEELLAIRERINFINLNYSRTSPQCDRAGLVWVARVIDGLARRHLEEPVWPGHDVTEQTKLLWEMKWYSDYCEAVVEIARSIQKAVKQGGFILRSSLTRVAFDENDLKPWLDMDILRTYSEKLKEPVSVRRHKNMVFDDWIDTVGLPPGAATLENLVSWAVSQNIATEEEINIVLGVTQASPLPIEEEAKGQDQRPSAEWVQKAIEIANRIGSEKWARGERQITARNICEAVATELSKGDIDNPQRYHGNQGARAATAVRNAALKGWKFTAPAGTNGTNGTDK